MRSSLDDSGNDVTAVSGARPARRRVRARSAVASRRVGPVGPQSSAGEAGWSCMHHCGLDLVRPDGFPGALRAGFPVACCLRASWGGERRASGSRGSKRGSGPRSETPSHLPRHESGVWTGLRELGGEPPPADSLRQDRGESGESAGIGSPDSLARRHLRWVRRVSGPPLLPHGSS